MIYYRKDYRLHRFTVVVGKFGVWLFVLEKLTRLQRGLTSLLTVGLIYYFVTPSKKRTHFKLKKVSCEYVHR